MKRKGIAYIEVLIASAILTGAIIPSYGYFQNLMQSQIRGEHYIVARNIIETQIELYRAKSKDQLVDGTQSLDTTDLPEGKITNTLINTDPTKPSLYSLEVQVVWQEPGGARNFSAGTLINPEGY